jgi:HK97 family phage prohead protease
MLVTGYAGLWNTPSPPDRRVHGHRVVFKPGCFTRCLREKPRPSLLLSHDPTQPLATGRNLAIWEDQKGLAFMARLEGAAAARMHRERQGTILGGSINWWPDLAVTSVRRDARLGSLLEAHCVHELLDVSIVYRPMFRETLGTIRFE